MPFCVLQVLLLDLFLMLVDINVNHHGADAICSRVGVASWQRCARFLMQLKVASEKVIALLLTHIKGWLLSPWRRSPWRSSELERRVWSCIGCVKNLIGDGVFWFWLDSLGIFSASIDF